MHQITILIMSHVIIVSTTLSSWLQLPFINLVSLHPHLPVPHLTPSAHHSSRLLSHLLLPVVDLLLSSLYGLTFLNAAKSADCVACSDTCA